MPAVLMVGTHDEDDPRHHSNERPRDRRGFVLRLEESEFCGPTVVTVFPGGRFLSARERALERCAMVNILIIDDDEDVLIRLERALEAEGYRTTTAGAGEKHSPLRRNPNSTYCW